MTRWGYGGRILDLNPRRPHGGTSMGIKINEQIDDVDEQEILENLNDYML